MILNEFELRLICIPFLIGMITSGFISLALLLLSKLDLDDLRPMVEEDISWFSFTQRLRLKFLNDAQYKCPSCILDLNDLLFLW